MRAVSLIGVASGIGATEQGCGDQGDCTIIK